MRRTTTTTLPRLFLLLAFTASTVTGCEGLGEDGTTTDDEAGDTQPPIIPECAPFDTSGGPGESYRCEGSGVGVGYFAINGQGTIVGCASNPAYNFDATGCMANPVNLADLSELPGGLAQPAACCEQAVETTDAKSACLVDCAHAECKLAIDAIRTLAGTFSNDCLLNPAQCNLRGDLYKQATRLETEEYQKCVSQIVMESPSPMTLDLGAGGGAAVLGNLDNLTLEIGCTVTDALLDDPPQECTDAEHTVTDPPGLGVITPGAVTIAGPYGSGSVNVLDVDYDVLAPRCSTPSCDFMLRGFDIELDDVDVHGFQFTNIFLGLDDIAKGTIAGTAVIIPTGALVFNVSTTVSAFGDDLFGTKPYVFRFSNSEPVKATWRSGVFEVQKAQFELGQGLAVLNTEPAASTFGD